MELTGTVKNIIFRNEENGWTVALLENENGDSVTVVGSLSAFSKGERITVEGDYTKHPRFGMQFKAVSCKILMPATLSAVESYLAGGGIKGIGAATARQIVEHFGMSTLEILDMNPERLLEIPGIGKKKLAMIMQSYTETRHMRDLLIALERYDITVAQARKLYGIYGEDCLTRIEEDPYQLIEDVDGIGFVTADDIARNVDGFSEDSPKRIRAAILYALQVACNEYGHTYLPRSKMIAYVKKLIGIDEDRLEEETDSLVAANRIAYRMVGDDDGVALPYLMQMENDIAMKLVLLSASAEDDPFLNSAAELPHHGIRLAGQQISAVKAALHEGVLVITGGPGTGKTTIIRHITEILAGMQMDFALAAPTGRAAKRMAEATGYDAKTLHRLLEFIPGEGFQRGEDNPLTCDMVIVDEVSMVDVPLMWHLLKAIQEGTRLVMVGDCDQLPSVGPGDVLRDITDSGIVPVVRLTEIFRQAQESRIVTNAHAINQGRIPLLQNDDSDFIFEGIHAQEQVLARIVSLYAHPDERLGIREPLMDIQVLAPMKKGILGVYNINAELQKALNPKDPRKKEQAFGDTVLRVGDKVMQVKNDYKIEWTKRGLKGALLEGTGAFNGDLGTIYAIDPLDKTFTVLFDDDRLAVYDFNQRDEIDLAYCISIHKSQGSEFPVVLMPLSGGPPMLLTRNLLYTAVTRAKNMVYIVGSENTVRQMVENATARRRYTSLKERLHEWKDIV